MVNVRRMARLVRSTPQQQRFVRGHPSDLPEPDGSVQGEQATVGRSEDALGRCVLDHCGKILILALDAVGGPEGATHPSTSAVGQVHRERVGQRTSKLHHVLRRICPTVQQDHARPLAQ